MRTRLLRLAPTALGLAVLVGIVNWLQRTVDFAAVGVAMSQARRGPLLLMLALTVLFGFLRALRLHVVLQSDGSYLRTYHVSNLGLLVNCLLPLRSGEMCMALLLGDRLPGGRSEALSRLFVDRLLDAITVFALFAATVPLLGDRSPVALNPERALSLGGAAVAAAIAAVWIACASEGLLVRSVGALARAVGQPDAPWKARASNVLNGLRALFHVRMILVAAGLSLAVWGIHVMALFAGMSALFPQPDLSWAMLGVVLTVLGLAVAPMPAGIGTTHGAIVLALGVFGVAPAQALAFAILYHAACTTLWVLLGMLGLWSLNIRLTTLLQGIGKFRATGSRPS